MILFDNVHFSIGDHPLFEGASFLVPEGARVGLIGPNGCGKTTIFNLILGNYAPDQGKVQVARGRRLSYLPQEPQFPEGSRGRAHVLESHPTLWSLLEAIQKVERQMESESDPHRLDRLVERHRQLLKQYDEEGGRDRERRVDLIFRHLGIAPAMSDRDLATLSGGEKKRVALAKIIFADAGILLLDEPLNYLDIEMVEWLEEFLLESPATLLFSSHDRYLLNRAAQYILEVRERRVFTYRGNYDAYVRQRSEEIALQQKLYEEQQEEIARELEFIRRNFYGQNASRAKSRVRKLERMEILEAPRQEDHAPQFSFSLAARGGDEVISMEEAACGFRANQPVIQDVWLNLQRRERVAILGTNGSGKTTLLRTMAGELPQLAGGVRRGARTKVGYYRQEPTEESSDRPVFEEIHDLVPKWTHLQVGNLLAAFLFRESRIRLPVKSLSGGEKARLALLRLVLSGANLLVLDEPTTHLDIPSREALEHSLEDFTETVVFVTHDRYFIERLADRFLVVENGRLRELTGGFEQYRQDLRRRREAEKQASEESRREKPKAAARRPPAGSPLPRIREEKWLQKIEALEAVLQKKHQDTARAEVYLNPEAMRRLKKEIADLEAQIAECYRVWEKNLEVGESGW
ncbi:MAG: ABC-F family ATP-binding cassette domain-containing protein [Planctomycetes bacterium]|nr:ABC-F family ATP-binding cassette domain-containing protein [Planctomycetota bacterium]